MTGLPRRSILVINCLAVARELLRLLRGQSCQFADIGAGDEGFFAAAGHDDDAYGIVVAGLVEGDMQLADRFAVERVELVRTIDGDAAHGATVFEEQVAKGHRRYLLSVCRRRRILERATVGARFRLREAVTGR